MQIDILKDKRRTIDIMYDGEVYTFTDRFYGVIGVAFRCDNRNEFNIMYGNSHYYYESDAAGDLMIIKDYIAKNESKFDKSRLNSLVFSDTYCKCNETYYFNINICKY